MKAIILAFIFSISLTAYNQVKISIPKINNNKEKKQDKNTSGDCNFQVGEKVEVYDPIEKKWFMSGILKADATKWFIHYDGYDSKWDTWADCSHIRRFGENKSTPPTTVATTNTNSSTNSSTVHNTSTANNTSNVAAVNIPIPVIVPGKNITLNIGDPFIYTDPSTKLPIKLFITSIELGNSATEHKFYATYNNNGFYYLSDFTLDPNYKYTELPTTTTTPENETYKIGDMVETFWNWDKTEAYKIIPGVIVSKDGDNYYIYFNKKNTFSNQYDWRYISDIRAIGSSKAINLIPDRGQPKEGLQACQQEINNSCKVDFLNNWDFLWYYRHDVQGFREPLSSESNAILDKELLVKVLNYYECLYNIRKKYPDIGNEGRTIETRYDVQYEFLKDYKKYIKNAFESQINTRVNNFTSDVANGYYENYYAIFDGKAKLQKKLEAEVNKYKENYAMLGGTISFSSLDQAYESGLKIFLAEKLLPNDGLINEGHSFTGKDARVEQLCINELKSQFPGAQVISSGCYGDYLIEKNSFGIPVYRTKTVLIIFSSSQLRVKARAHFTLREEYVNGKYTSPSFPRDGTLEYLK